MRRFRGSPGLPLATVSLLALLLVTVGAGSARGTTHHGVISGSVFADLNRDGTYQPDEPPLPDRQLYLFKGDAYVGTTLSDAAGRYSFGDLDDGEYSIECDASGLRADWVPSTTPSLDPKVAVSVNGAGDEYIDFGWRRLVHSTDPNLPLTTFVASTGLRIEMFNDALPAQALYERLMTGTLVGPEAASVTLRFGYGDASTTTTGVQESNGLYTNFLAVMQIGWGSWLNTGENALFHEYGHAWSLYHAYIVQQDPMFAGYLAVRGLTNDPQAGHLVQLECPRAHRRGLSAALRLAFGQRRDADEHGSSGRHAGAWTGRVSLTDLQGTSFRGSSRSRVDPG